MSENTITYNKTVIEEPTVMVCMKLTIMEKEPDQF
jgi:hypothetical protein